MSVTEAKIVTVLRHLRATPSTEHELCGLTKFPKGTITSLVHALRGLELIVIVDKLKPFEPRRGPWTRVWSASQFGEALLDALDGLD